MREESCREENNRKWRGKKKEKEGRRKLKGKWGDERTNRRWKRERKKEKKGNGDMKKMVKGKKEGKRGGKTKFKRTNKEKIQNYPILRRETVIDLEHILQVQVAPTPS